MLDPSYHMCGWVYEGPSSDSSVPLEVKYQKAVNVHMSGFTKKTVVLTIFFIKEANYITAMTVGLILFLGLICPLMLIVWPIYAYVIVPYYLKVSPTNHADYQKNLIGMYVMIYDLLSVVFMMCLNLSSTYRLFVYVDQIYHLTINVSIKDMERKMTGLANTIFMLLLVMLTGDEGAPSNAVNLSIATTMLLLVYTMCAEQLNLKHISAGLRDLNQNHLSSFETALLWIKIMEDFLDDDIMFNWVQVFAMQEPLLPDVFDKLWKDEETAKLDDEKKRHEQHVTLRDAEGNLSYGQFMETLKGTGLKMMEDNYIKSHTDHKIFSKTEIQDLLYLPWLDNKDVENFGHDRKGKRTETPIESTGIRSLDAVSTRHLASSGKLSASDDLEPLRASSAHWIDAISCAFVPRIEITASGEETLRRATLGEQDQKFAKNIIRNWGRTENSELAASNDAIFAQSKYYKISLEEDRVGIEDRTSADGRNIAIENEMGAAEGVSVVIGTFSGIAESSASGIAESSTSDDTIQLPAPVPSPAGLDGIEIGLAADSEL